MTDSSIAIWLRVVANQKQPFKTIKGKTFYYILDGNGIRPFPNGRPTNRRITRKQFDEAVSRCPLQNTTDLQDLIGPSYLFGILTDRRIRQNAW